MILVDFNTLKLPKVFDSSNLSFIQGPGFAGSPLHHEGKRKSPFPVALGHVLDASKEKLL